MNRVCGFKPTVVLPAKVMPLKFHVAFEHSFGWLNDTPIARDHFPILCVLTSRKSMSYMNYCEAVRDVSNDSDYNLPIGVETGGNI